MTKALPYVFWIGTPAFRKILYISSSCEKICGRNPESFYKSPRLLLDIIYPDDRRKFLAELATGTIENRDFLYRIIRTDGSLRWLWRRHFPIRDEEGKILYTAAVAVDVTDIKQAAGESEQSFKDFQKLADDTGLGIFRSDLGGRLFYVNEALARMFECTDPDEMLGRAAQLGYIDAQDKQGLLGELKKHKIVQNYELELKTTTGKTKYVLVNARLEGDEILGLVFDLTDRKCNELHLLHEGQRYELAQRAANIGCWDWNIETGQLVWSEQIEPMFGFVRGRFPGTYQAFLDCIHPEDRQFVIDRVNACIEQGRDYAIEHRILQPDGMVRWVSEIGNVVRNAQGKAIRMLGVVRDITDTKRTQRRQTLGWKILERINQKQDEQDVIRDLLALIREFTGFDAVGIRLRRGDDFPYFETSGFSPEFVVGENFLCLRDSSGCPVLDSRGLVMLECMCGNVLMGHSDPSLPFFTEAGSFWTNSTSALLQSKQLDGLGIPLRNRCNQAGFESMALIPLRSGEQVIGLLQLNDRRPDQLDLETVKFFEGMGASVGIALDRISNVEHIRELNEELERRVDERTAELIKANRELRQEIEQRKQLEKEILEISEREQRRIGQELHDSLGQQLTGIAFMLKVLEQKLANTLPEEATRSAQIAQLVKQANDQARALARGLHPVDLEAGNLVEGLFELAISMEKLFSISCNLDCDDSVLINESPIAVNIYRIVQEAVTNAVKHGKAKNIWIRLVGTESGYALTIENDGLDLPQPIPKTTGMGLRIISHRAELIKAKLDIKRRPQGGAIITCTFPADKVGSNGVVYGQQEIKDKEQNRESKDIDSR